VQRAGAEVNFSIGDTVGGYEIVGVLGSGGMGEVYRVRNVISDRVDAMKVLLASLQREQDFATRFLREIKVQARLVHPNIAQLYTAFEQQGNLMMILELVDGMSLLDMLQRGRIPLRDAVDYASQALTALSYAHGQGVIHRDIKPGNIMVTRSGVVKLMDFGIAKAATDRSLTVPGNLIGSLYYMSPEQVRAEAIDSRSDLYSVGVVLYQMATGKKPFDGASEYTIMRAQVEQLPAAPSAIDPTIPEELSQILLRSLAKAPADRFQSGDEFRAALQQVATLLQEAEIGMTRMLGTPRVAAITAPPQPREAPAPARDRTPQRPPVSAVARDEISTTPARTPVPPRREPASAAHPTQAPSTRPRTRFWIASGIAAAVLLAAGSQVLDWTASQRPSQPSPGSPSVDLQVPPDRPKSTATPPQAGGETPPAPQSGSAVPKSRPGPGSGASGVAGPSGAPSKPAAREGSQKALSKATFEPQVTTPAARAPSVPAPSANTGAAPPTVSKTMGSAAAVPSGPATKTASPPAAEKPLPESSPTNATPPSAPQPAATDHVYEPAEVDTSPRLLRQVQPRYSEAAQRAGVQGKVRLTAEIWPDGRAHNIRVLQSVGHADLDRNAVAALSMWQFAPGRKGGVAVKVRAIIDQTYRLQGGRPSPALSKDQ
jgi:serine/threonine-protein kinase